MRAAVVLQCALVILAVHVAVACQVGELVEARFSDGSWKEATIVEVRDRPNGVCGHYRVIWAHSYICEDPSITGDDTRVGMKYCLLSRDAIKSCKQELCRWGDSVESDKNKPLSTSANDKDNRYIIFVILLVPLSLICVVSFCIFCRLGYEANEVDEEKGRDAVTPCGTSRSLKSGKSFWNFTPKSATSGNLDQTLKMSQLATWISKTRKTAEPSNKNKVVVHPEPVAAQFRAAVLASKKKPEAVAAKLAAKNQNVKLQITEQKHVQPETKTVPDDPLCPPVVLQAHGSALRHAARTHGGPSVPPPQSICAPPQLPSMLHPPPQLPTLLQHRESGTKKPHRKKPPLQGVPPQGTAFEQGKNGPASYKTRSQAPYFM